MTRIDPYSYTTAQSKPFRFPPKPEYEYEYVRLGPFKTLDVMHPRRPLRAAYE